MLEGACSPWLDSQRPRRDVDCRQPTARCLLPAACLPSAADLAVTVGRSERGGARIRLRTLTAKERCPSPRQYSTGCRRTASGPLWSCGAARVAGRSTWEGGAQAEFRTARRHREQRSTMLDGRMRGNRAGRSPRMRCGRIFAPRVVGAVQSAAAGPRSEGPPDRPAGRPRGPQCMPCPPRFPGPLSRPPPAVPLECRNARQRQPVPGYARHPATLGPASPPHPTHAPFTAHGRGGLAGWTVRCVSDGDAELQGCAARPLLVRWSAWG